MYLEDRHEFVEMFLVDLDGCLGVFCLGFCYLEGVDVVVVFSLPVFYLECVVSHRYRSL